MKLSGECDSVSWSRPHAPEKIPPVMARRLSIVTSALGAGGAERVISLLARHWVERGWKVTIIAFDRPGDPVYHPLHPEVALVRLDLPGGAIAVPRRVRALRAALKRERPDIAIGFLTKINALLLAAAIGISIPLLVSERNNPSKQGAHPAWNRALRLLYRRADAIICQTAASVACLPAKVRGRVRVIANPIMPPEATPAASDSAIGKLVAVGRLTEQKGFDLLIDAFARIAGRHPGWTLDIWGEGGEREALEEAIAAHGLAGRVRLPGVSVRPGGWAEGASAFVLSSRYEGFPNVLGEAMALGLPSLAFACDFGPSELVDDSRNGLLVRAGDVAALADGLDRLLGDAPLRARLGAAARSVAVRLGLDRIAGQWDSVIETLWAGQPARPVDEADG